MSWYYASNQQQLGPISEEELNQKISSGEVSPSTLVWKEGMTDWLPLSSARGGPVTAPGMVLCLCNNTFPIAETVKIGEQWVCPACKDIAIQRLLEGVSTASQFNYAGFWIRVAAKIIDGILLTVINVVIQIVMTAGVGALSIMQKNGNDGKAAVLSIALILITLVVQMAIYAGFTIYFVGRNGATPGKMLCRLKIIRADGQPLSYGRATGRFFAEFVSQISCYVGYIMAGLDEEKRSLHDRICDTRVIQQS